MREETVDIFVRSRKVDRKITQTIRIMSRPFYTRLYDTFIKIQSNHRRNKLHRMNQGSNFLGGNFSNRDNVRAPIQIRREREPQHLKRWFLLKNGPIHFHINSTSIIRLVKQNQLSFSGIEINNPLPAPVNCVS